MQNKYIKYLLSSGTVLSLFLNNQVYAETVEVQTETTLNEAEIENTNNETLESFLNIKLEETISYSSELIAFFKETYVIIDEDALTLVDSNGNILTNDILSSEISDGSWLVTLFLDEEELEFIIPITEEIYEEPVLEEPVLENPEEITPIEEKNNLEQPNETDEIEKPVETVVEEEVKVDPPQEETETPIEKEEVVEEVAPVIVQPKMASKAKIVAIQPIPANGYHVVQSGDTLSKIANKYGLTLKNLIDWNQVENANLIKVGQKISLDPSKAIDEKPFKTRQEFLNYFIPIMTKIANENGLFPSIMIAQAAHESNYGESLLSRAPYYNLFGIKGSYNGNSVVWKTWEEIDGKNVIVDDKFRDYDSYLESIYDYVRVLQNTMLGGQPRYSRTWTENSKDYRDAAYGLILDKTVTPNKGGYATDSSYAVKIINLIEAYELYNYDPNLNGWHVIGGKERFYRNDQFLTGMKKVRNTTYLFSGDGSKQYGWHRLNGKDYYFNPQNGGMWTGKRKIGNTTYLLTGEGSKSYGWHRLNGKDYYFDPQNGGMWTGKRKVGNVTYLFNSSGEKQYGWYFDGKHKYYFNTTNGGMLTGLRKINGAHYYFTLNSGQAITNKTMTINGNKWIFNSQGVGTRK